MENIAENPYKAPEADVAVDNGSKNLINVFDRFSAWGVLGLSIITLGIYVIYWLFNRSKKINNYVDNPISAGYMYTALALYISSFVLPFFGVGEGVSGVISIAAGIMQVVWYYKIRNRIHAYKGAQEGTYAWIGPVKTFFFNILYLQYKINKIIDNE